MEVENLMVDPISLEVFKNRFASIAAEMGMVLRRTAHSPNIKERLDFSCAIFDAAGRMIAQAAHIPVHLGAMPISVITAIKAIDFAPGDVVILNDPFHGGSHLPDITMITPIFVQGAGQSSPHLFGFAASRAHHADVGGMSPGSMPLSQRDFSGRSHHSPVEAGGEGTDEPGLVEFAAGQCTHAFRKDGRLAGPDGGPTAKGLSASRKRSPAMASPR